MIKCAGILLPTLPRESVKCHMQRSLVSVSSWISLPLPEEVWSSKVHGFRMTRYISQLDVTRCKGSNGKIPQRQRSRGPQ